LIEIKVKIQFGGLLFGVKYEAVNSIVQTNPKEERERERERESEGEIQLH
jgi:hypothetical protein